MSLKQYDKTDDLVIDLTNAEYFAPTSAPSSKVLLALPDRLDPVPPPRREDKARYGDLGLAASLPIKRPRIRPRLRDVDSLTVLGISVVLTVGAFMLMLVATFRH